MGEMAAELTGRSVLKLLMWSIEAESNSWEEIQDTQHSMILIQSRSQYKSDYEYVDYKYTPNYY